MRGAAIKRRHPEQREGAYALASVPLTKGPQIPQPAKPAGLRTTVFE